MTDTQIDREFNKIEKADMPHVPMPQVLAAAPVNV